MPNRKSAIKELRKSATNNVYNKKIKDTAKNLVKKGAKAILASDDKAKEIVAKALKNLDKAAQKGVLKKNTANRRKSRLAKKLNKLATSK